MTLTVNESLLDRTVSHHVEIHRLAAGAIRQALNRLNESDAELYDAIYRGSHPDDILRVNRVDRVLSAVRAANNRAYRDIETELVRQLKSMAVYEVDFNSDLLETVLPFEWTVARPKSKLVRAIVEEEPMYGGLLTEWIAGMAEGRFTRVRRAIRYGVAAGETGDQIIRRIRGRRSLNYRDGALQISRRSLDQTVDSLYVHVANKSKATLFSENGDLIEAVQWTAVLDDKTCYHCGSLDTMVYKVIEMSEDGKPIIVLDPTAGVGPPLHPNCRCVLIPVIYDWESIDVPPEELSADDKRRLNGKPSKRWSYESWLKRQSKSLQNAILGVERAKMFRRGLSINKFSDASGIKYTLPELRRVEARTLAPKKTGQPLLKDPTTHRNYGWKPDLPDQRDRLFAVENPEDVALPVRVSLRADMPPVFNQGELGSCTANALVAAMMFAHGKNTPMLSRLDLYFKERVLEDTVNEDAGAEIRDGIKALVKWGVCTEQTWPYKVRSFRQRPNLAAQKEDDAWKATSYQRLKGHDDFLKCLAKGNPFVGGFSVYESFDRDTLTKKGVMSVPKVTEKMIAGHAVLVVGYDGAFYDNTVFKASGLQTSQVSPFAYECRNSFGPQWGDEGYFWMPAEYLENRDLSDDMWVIFT